MIVSGSCGRRRYVSSILRRACRSPTCTAGWIVHARWNASRRRCARPPKTVQVNAGARPRGGKNSAAANAQRELFCCPSCGRSVQSHLKHQLPYKTVVEHFEALLQVMGDPAEGRRDSLGHQIRTLSLLLVVLASVASRDLLVEVEIPNAMRITITITIIIIILRQRRI